MHSQDQICSYANDLYKQNEQIQNAHRADLNPQYLDHLSACIEK